MSSYEQERHEILDSVFQVLSRHPSDPDEMAACAYLVRHLTHPVDSPSATP